MSEFLELTTKCDFIINGFSIKDTILEGDVKFYPTLAMISRITPEIGDYLVMQEDGYKYFNPKDVFLRKYSRIEEV